MFLHVLNNASNVEINSASVDAWTRKSMLNVCVWKYHMRAIQLLYSMTNTVQRVAFGEIREILIA